MSNYNQLAILGGEKALARKASTLSIKTLPQKAFDNVKALMDKKNANK